MAPFPSAAWSSGWPRELACSHLSACRLVGSGPSLPSGELALFSQAPLGERFLLTPFLPIAYCSGPRKANWLCFARSAWGRFPAFLRRRRQTGIVVLPRTSIRVPAPGSPSGELGSFCILGLGEPPAPCLLRVPDDLRGNQEKSGRCPPILLRTAARSRPVLLHEPGSGRRGTPGPCALLAIHFSIAASAQ